MSDRLRGAGIALAIAAISGIFVATQKDPAPRQMAGQAAQSVDPESCLRATAKLKERYETVQRCKSDLDCNYISGFYEIVPREDRSKRITTQHCETAAPPLVVANGKAVEEQLEDLRSEQGLVDATCGTQGRSTDCGSAQAFRTVAPAACVEGRCRNTSIDW